METVDSATDDDTKKLQKRLLRWVGSGDDGETRLYSGKKVKKSNYIFAVLGQIDHTITAISSISCAITETIARDTECALYSAMFLILLGVCCGSVTMILYSLYIIFSGRFNRYLTIRRRSKEYTNIVHELARIVNNLYLLSSEIAGATSKTGEFSPEKTEELEKFMCNYRAVMPELRNFVIPGGSKISCACHNARVSARSMEWMMHYLSADEREKINPNILRYSNRLSTYFFDLARYCNQLENVQEIILSS